MGKGHSFSVSMQGYISHYSIPELMYRTAALASLFHDKISG